MRKRSIIIAAFVLVFALIFTACAARRPLQNPVQPRQDTTGLYDNNRGVGSGTGRTTGIGTRTGIGAGGYTGRGPSASDPYDLGFGAGNNAGTGTTGTGMGDTTYYGGSNNSPNFALNNTAGTTQTDSIERALEQMTGVNNATVVVSGNTAYVGIDTGGDLTGRNISYGNANDLAAVKSACAQRVKSANPNIRTVYVSTDANFFDRLRSVGDRVRNGGNVNNFRSELNSLIRGLTPER